MNLDQQVRRAIGYVDFYRLGFECLLRAETQKARQYLQGALLRGPLYKGKNLTQLILDNLDRVQLIVTDSKEDFNELRKKYGMTPF